MLYRFCARHDVPHRRCGKLIVARTEAELTRLGRLQARGEANGVSDLEIIDDDAVRQLEPHVAARAALWSPSTGIVDPEALVRALRRDAERRGSSCCRDAPRRGPVRRRRGRGAHPGRDHPGARGGQRGGPLRRRGLGATRRPPVPHPPLRGEYAELLGASRALVGRPVYPVPAPAGEHLGVHLTPTTWGDVAVGPTVHYQRRRTTTSGTGCRSTRSSSPPGRSCPRCGPPTSDSAAPASARSSAPTPPSSPTS